MTSMPIVSGFAPKKNPSPRPTNPSNPIQDYVDAWKMNKKMEYVKDLEEKVASGTASKWEKAELNAIKTAAFMDEMKDSTICYMA